MTAIDINCDLGEGAGNDEALLPWITSANIACGFHAGSPAAMRQLVTVCCDRGVAIGAHPGLRDAEGFGRRELPITPEDAYDIVVYQTGALLSFALAAGASLAHVKPHGALYNMAARDAALAEAIAQAVRDIDRSLVLFGLANSELIAAGERLGIATAAEAFVDRAYLADGALVPRDRADAFVHDSATATERVIGMVRDGRVSAVDGSVLHVRPRTVCIHSDTPNAPVLAHALRTGLERAGIVVSVIAAHGPHG